ncbi:MAG: hypothetical protein V1875_03090 [Candidatus Altiarchaeota archaeon]
MERRTSRLLFSAFCVMLASVSVTALSTAYSTRICSLTGDSLDYLHWGITRDASGAYNDTCVNATFLRKWYCLSGSARSVIHRCEYGCADGECVADNPNLITHAYVCTDTDNGTDYFKRGVVNGNKEDRCITNHRLREYYCKGKMAMSTAYICPDMCISGACTGEYSNPTTWVTSTWTTITATSLAVTATSQTSTTSTTTTTSVTSTTLAGTGQVTASSTTVPTTSTTLSACTETDGGRDFFANGTSSDPRGIHNDDCVGQRRIQEWYCSNGEAKSAYGKCAKGCVNGACLPETRHMY